MDMYIILMLFSFLIHLQTSLIFLLFTSHLFHFIYSFFLSLFLSFFIYLYLSFSIFSTRTSSTWPHSFLHPLLLLMAPAEPAVLRLRWVSQWNRPRSEGKTDAWWPIRLWARLTTSRLRCLCAGDMGKFDFFFIYFVKLMCFYF